MANDTDCRPVVRRLTFWEKEEAYKVFAEQLNYSAVRIHECAAWPDTVNRLGMRVKGMIPKGEKGKRLDLPHNAITLGNHCYFPVILRTRAEPPLQPPLGDMSWLIHELTHVWQYQHMGPLYLVRALGAQIRLKEKAYVYGGAEGLMESFKKNLRLGTFNLEQQGDIARDYYNRLCQKEDVASYTPYIEELQKRA